MMEYWDERCPVKTDNPHLVASVFKGSDEMIIAIGNWSAENQRGTLQFDWTSLGMQPQDVDLIVPGIPDFQGPLKLHVTDPIVFEGGKGLLLVLKTLKK